MGKFILVLGGARSGKSSFAEKITAGMGGKIIYLATAQALDEEMAERVKKHRKRRPSHWKTIEEPTNPADVIEQQGMDCDAILLDCITLLLSNWLCSGKKEKDILPMVELLAQKAREADTNVVMVSNELGLGLVPPSELGREYRDITGRANQILASYADEVYFVIAGIPIKLKPNPNN